MKSNVDILREVLTLVKNELNEVGAENGIGYTMPDGKYHIYIYLDELDDEKVYVVEPNRVEDGAHEPFVGDTHIAPYQDFTELLLGCEWCFEQFDLDRGKTFAFVDHLSEFIKKEVPFRIAELYDLPLTEDVESALVECVDNNTDVMFDYDKFDNFLLSKYEELVRMNTYEVTVNYLEGKEEKSFFTSFVAAEKPDAKWTADFIRDYFSRLYTGNGYNKAIDSVYCVELQITNNGEYVDRDELCGSELLDVLRLAKVPQIDKKPSIDEQIKDAVVQSSEALKIEDIKRVVSERE